MFSFKKLPLKKWQFILLIFCVFFISIFSFYHHLPNKIQTYNFPLHLDEWNSISKVHYLMEGGYDFFTPSCLEIGFHLFLAFLNNLFDLILIYKFLPAIWVFLTSLIFFFLVHKITNKNFLISLLSILFFGSIYSTGFYMGLEFFTPLSFATPFVFMYIFFFIYGLHNEKKKSLLISLIFMVSLLVIHPFSLLFAIPILLIIGFIYRGYIKREFNFFLLFLTLPLFGFFLYYLVNRTSFNFFEGLYDMIIFGNNWADVQVDYISFNDLYTLPGYILAFVGMIGLFIKKEKKYLTYLIWPLYLFLSLLFFNFFKISFFSPAQRNYYYFIISLPFLSSLGVYFLFRSFNKFLQKVRIPFLKSKNLKKFLIFFLIFLIIFFTYSSSLNEKQKFFFGRINYDDYEILSYLSLFPQGRVIAPLGSISIAVKSVSGHEPITTLYFYGDDLIREDVNYFFEDITCEKRYSITDNYYVDYIVSTTSLNCERYFLLFKTENRFIYQVSKSYP
jgi:hypothetical protein